MLKLHDAYCEECGFMGEIYCENNNLGYCEECGAKLKKAYLSFNFKLEYNPKKDTVAWASSNYETSQYWSNVKEEKFKNGKTPSHPGSCDHPIPKK